MSFFARLFLGKGTFPDDVRAQIETEGALALEEGLRGSIVYRDYRAPGDRAHVQRVGTVGAIAVTSERLVVLAPGRQKDDPVVSLVWTDTRVTALKLLAQPDGLKLTFGAAAFGPDRSGHVEVFLRSADPERLVALIDAQRRP